MHMSWPKWVQDEGENGKMNWKRRMQKPSWASLTSTHSKLASFEEFPTNTISRAIASTHYIQQSKGSDQSKDMSYLQRQSQNTTFSAEHSSPNKNTTLIQTQTQTISVYLNQNLRADAEWFVGVGQLSV